MRGSNCKKLSITPVLSLRTANNAGHRCVPPLLVESAITAPSTIPGGLCCPFQIARRLRQEAKQDRAKAKIYCSLRCGEDLAALRREHQAHRFVRASRAADGARHDCGRVHSAERCAGAKGAGRAGRRVYAAVHAARGACRRVRGQPSRGGGGSFLVTAGALMLTAHEYGLACDRCFAAEESLTPEYIPRAVVAQFSIALPAPGGVFCAQHVRRGTRKYGAKNSLYNACKRPHSVSSKTNDEADSLLPQMSSIDPLTTRPFLSTNVIVSFLHSEPVPAQKFCTSSRYEIQERL
eukprot:IDg11283t1